MDDVAAWEAAAPLDNEQRSVVDGIESDVAEKEQGSETEGGLAAPDSGRGEGEGSTSASEPGAEVSTSATEPGAKVSTSATESGAERLSVVPEVTNGGEEEEDEEDAFEDAEEGADDDDAGDDDNDGGEFQDSSSTSEAVTKADDLHRIVEMELNQPITAAHGEAPADALQIHVYHLPLSTCLALRCHRAIVDRPAVRVLATALVSALHHVQSAVAAAAAAAAAAAGDGGNGPPRLEESASLPPPLSSLIPKPSESLSYLAKGLSQAYDAMAYVRNAMASSHPPFQPGRADCRKNQFRSSFSCLRFDKQETEGLLSSLASQSCSLFSLECAAALKAVADVKQLGSRTQTFNVTSIMNCRSLLDPPLPPDAMGVFTSGLPLKQPVNQDLPLWDVARTVDADLAAAVGQKKHFTDMPVLELLFSTAMKTPTFSPECSRRTSFMSAITESPFPMDWPCDGGVAPGTIGGGRGLETRLEGFMGPIFATHGVGPSISIADALHDGDLQIYINFVSPLFSQQFMASFIRLFEHYFREAMC
ncbi:hypothetical protein CLOM_g19423 [Closterium sp. NIES-68]|nr:hypothetical protein CLOM_g19423 [Closterium sp. NIES-68]GJP76922.1 hypothetical protein CLOP_g7368 [Closterium sp. NIES-67]